MKRSQFLKAFALSVFVTLPAFAAGPHVAIVKEVSGQLSVVRDGASVAAVAGTQLLVSDRLVAAEDSTAAITFMDGTLLTLGPRADVLLRGYLFQPKNAQYDFSLYLSKGSAVYSSGKIGKLAPAAVRVDTPTGTVGVRGTRFIIEAE